MFLEFLFDMFLLPIMKKVHWVPTSRKHLAEAEDRLMSCECDLCENQELLWTAGIGVVID